MEQSTVAETPWMLRLYARCWFIWGLSLCYRGNRSIERSFYEAGVAAFSQAARLWPNFAAAHYQSGLIKGRELGLYRAAIIELERASRLRPEWPEPYLQRGLFHRFNHNPSDAQRELEAFLERGGSPFWRAEASNQLAQIAAERGGGERL